MKRSWTLAWLVLPASVACAPSASVERAYDGHVVDGRFIAPAAYAAFLRGAIADAGGDARGALVAYASSAELDPQSAETWTRIGALRCALDPADARADEALGRALALDQGYAGAWEARARCSFARGALPASRDAALRAAGLDPARDGANALLARTTPEEGSPATRDALVALTVTARDPLTAWDALESWARAHGDVPLRAQALRALVRLAPGRRDAAALAAEELAGSGELAEARAVAAAAFDAAEEPVPDGRHALAARLAVDEAIARDDVDQVRARATRARLALDDVAARAALEGHAELARELATEKARAEPAAPGPRVVLAAVDGGDLVGAARDAGRIPGRVPGEAWLAFGERIVHVLAPADARRSLAAMQHEALVPGDDLVARVAADLAARGAMDPRELPANAAVELAALNLEGPGVTRSSFDEGALDPRHEYLLLALAEPHAARATELGERLRSVLASDRIVAAAAALIGLSTGAPGDPAAASALLARDPADPLLAATAFRLAEKAGDSAAATRARASLALPFNRRL